ncbi:hypothetical protein M9H77_08776 [Catharanthus roseus]|uniref:Uncharacterized protein n=1 Tax=Catharanthus roseus TaxID=4058 RepID=A0ACC0BYY0_CATRO|nr:hypothetical protein M9H77_08776 [Catharanthus roseus]
MCLDSLRLLSCARNPHFSAERHVDILLSRMILKNSMYLVKWTLSLLLSQQKELSGTWFYIRYILSITSCCRSVNVKMKKLATASPEWEVEPRIE